MRPKAALLRLAIREDIVFVWICFIEEQIWFVEKCILKYILHFNKCGGEDYGQF